MKHHTASNASRPKALIFTAILAVFCAASAMAQNFLTGCYTNYSTDAHVAEGYLRHVFDNDINTYVVLDYEDSYTITIEFETSQPVIPTSYDISANYYGHLIYMNSCPTQWSLYAEVDQSWVVVDDNLETHNLYWGYESPISGILPYCQHFKIVFYNAITTVPNTQLFLSGIKFRGYGVYDISQCNFSNLPPDRYLFRNEAINLPTPVVTSTDGSNPVVPLISGVHFNTVITNGNGEVVTEVKNPGDYTLTFNGISPCTGSWQFPFSVIKPWQGYGYNGRYYNEIYTTADLDLLAEFVNSGEFTMEGMQFSLMCNIAYDPNTPNNYAPIGNAEHPFCGTFDGNGRTVSGIRISGDSNCQGLFGACQDATLSGIILNDAQFSGGANVGGIVGLNNGSTVKNCIVDATTVSAGGGAIVCANNGGTLQHNYYLGCTVGSATTNIGTSTGDTDGARLALPVMLPSTLSFVSGSSNGIIYNGQLYGGPSESLPLNVDESIGYYYQYTCTNCTITLNDGPTYTLAIASEATTTVTVNFNLSIFWDVDHGADGSAEHPYLITSTDEMDYLAYRVNTFGNSFPDKYFNLMNDLAYDPNNLTVDHDGDGINESNYTAIGCGDPFTSADPIKYFKGHFDGCGHTISGIQLYNPNNIGQGIFGYIRGSETSTTEVKNLTLDNAVITGKWYIGGIVGYSHYYEDDDIYFDGLITNCHVTNTVTIQILPDRNPQYIGGIVGMCHGVGPCSHCTSAATINVFGGSTYVSGCGGISGQGITSYCTSTATITIGSDLYKVTRVGGISGGGSASYCTSMATITFSDAPSRDMTSIGGVLGSDNSYVNHCLAVGVTMNIITPDSTTLRGVAAIAGTSQYSTLDHNYYYNCDILGETTNVGYGLVVSTNPGWQFYIQDLPENDGAMPLGVLLHDDGTDNTATIADHLNEPNSICIYGRTLYKDGTWNTLCLPFGVDNFVGTPLEDADVRELESATLADGVVTLNFGDPITSITAGTPYIVRWAVGGDDLYSPVFSGVTITATEPQTVSLLNGAVNFIGNFVPFADPSGLQFDEHNAYNSAFHAALQVPEDCEVVFNVQPICLMPTDFAVGDVTMQSAELGWNVIYPDEEDYTVRYRATQNYILEEDFSNGLDCGWTIRDNANRSKVSNGRFMFLDATDTPQYLISPLLTDVTEGVTLELNYQHWSRTDYTIQVGFSSTDNASESFTFIDPIPFVTPHATWNPYSAPVPAGTRYICWRYWFPGPDNMYDNELFYIDDIVVVKDFPDIEWQTLDVVVKGPQMNATLDGLAPQTTYEAQVKCDYCGEEDWSETVSFKTSLDHLTVDGDEYTIYTATGWDRFCDALQDDETYNHFSGKTVKLAADISVTRMAGSTDHEFRGIFDGQGHTLNVAINDITTNSAPFREIRGATIRNLKVTGSVVGIRHSAGLVAIARGEDSSIVNTVENCLVSTDVTATNDQKCYLGGIVGHGLKSSLIIRGCVFNGSLTSTSYYVGGLQGWSDGNTLTLEDDLFDGTVNAAPEGFHPVAIHAKYQETTANVSNVYYTVEPTVPTNSPYIAATGQLVIASTAVSPVGEATATYDVSDLAFYSNGVQYGDLFYYDPEAVATQTIALASGWNWVSVNVEITLDDLKAAILAADAGASPVIKSKNNGQTTYNGAVWVGGLKSIDLSQMYEIKVANACSIMLEGVLVNPEDHPATLKNGANWIAYPLTEIQTVTNVFSGFPTEGDNIKSKTGGQAAWNGVIWIGALKRLEPGKGYIYTSTAADNRTFVFPASK